MIRAVLIDIDDTIFDFPNSGLCAMQLAAARMGLTLPEETFSHFGAVNKALWQRLERGEISLDTLFYTRWDAVFSRVGVEADGAEFERQFHRGLAESAIEVEGAGALVRYLAEKYDLYAASNGSCAQQASRLSLAGLAPYFRAYFVSDAVGHSKPSREFFAACFARMGGVTPEETVMVGDSLSADIAGAAAYGIHTCWFNKKGIAPPPDLAAEHTVTDLADICSIL